MISFRTLKYMVHDLEMGVKSRFSPCCILWFFVRNYILDVPAKLHGKYYSIELKHARRLKAEHILCPAHWLSKKPIQYYTCNDCDWLQCNDEKCGWCGSSSFETGVIFYTKPRWLDEANF